MTSTLRRYHTEIRPIAERAERHALRELQALGLRAWRTNDCAAANNKPFDIEMSIMTKDGVRRVGVEVKGRSCTNGSWRISNLKPYRGALLGIAVCFQGHAIRGVATFNMRQKSRVVYPSPHLTIQAIQQILPCLVAPDKYRVTQS